MVSVKLIPLADKVQVKILPDDSAENKADQAPVADEVAASPSAQEGTFENAQTDSVGAAGDQKSSLDEPVNKNALTPEAVEKFVTATLTVSGDDHVSVHLKPVYEVSESDDKEEKFVTVRLVVNGKDEVKVTITPADEHVHSDKNGKASASPTKPKKNPIERFIHKLKKLFK